MELLNQIASIEASHGIGGMLVVLFGLLIGHGVSDFALQGEFLAAAKSRHAELTKFFYNETPPKGVWIYALGAHSLIHAGAVWVITGSVFLAFVEFVLHWMIDFAKCESWTSFQTDQGLHIACKVAYAILIGWGCSCVNWSL